MSEKKEYIERVALSEFVRDVRKKLPKDSKDFFTRDEMLLNFQQYVDLRPAADVEPVVRARWENHFGEKICSACMGATPIFANIRNHKYENCKQYETEFCPHCGAHMERSGSGE